MSVFLTQVFGMEEAVSQVQALQGGAKAGAQAQIQRKVSRACLVSWYLWGLWGYTYGG